MKNKFKLSILAASILFASQSFAQTQVVDEVKSASQSVTSASLVKKSVDVSSEEVAQMRQNMIKEMASNYGVSAGLSWKLNKIKTEELSVLEKRLNNFDFSKLAIDAGVLPPVIIESNSNYAQNNDDEVRLSDKTFKILKHAKFYSVYPSWRDYLIFDVPAPAEIPASLLPKTPAESKIWDHWATTAFEQGVIQAQIVFQNSLDRMDQEYNGMLKFHQLLAQGQVTPTLISKHNMGVTGGGREMRINDQVFRIMDHSALVSDESKWENKYPITNKNNGIYK